MKLNPDCIRDILLTIEESTDYDHFFVCSIESAEEIEFLHGSSTPYNTKNDYPRLSQYSTNEIGYHFRQCVLSDFLVNHEYGSVLKALDLSPSGHEFLANIRTPENWSKTKKVCLKAGSVALSVITAAAEGVANAALKNALGTSE